ncbi:MAG: hypothetical protein J5365_06405 [Erysipelotrichaceae bacterium]|nr:hypothetical protein [Erysipelotrichaceae bacterium]
MTEISVREYDAKLDSKKRITLRNAVFDYFHVSELEDGRILLEPRELVKPFSVSANTLSMMDQAVENMKNNKVSGKLDLSEFED